MVAVLATGLMVSGVLIALPPVSSTAASASLVEIGSDGQPSNGRGAFATANFGGWLQGFATGDMWSSPAVGDVTGDGVPEIVVGGVNSIARVYSISGQLLTTIDPGGADVPGGVGATHASPALGDINGDGTDDIVLANTGSIMAAYSFKNRVLVNLMKKFEDRAFNSGPNGLFATPALGYVDGDNRLDIVTASWGQRLDVWSGRTADRVANWPQWLKDTIWSSPAIGDVDGDGANEIVIGGDCDGSGSLQPCYGMGGGGYIWVFNLDGTVKWKYFVSGQAIWSSPALADLNGDGGLDIVVGTGAYWPEPAGRKVIALNGKTGKLMWEAPTSARVVGSPSVGDVDGDGKPEVFIVSRGAHLLSYDGENGHLRFDKCIDDGSSCGDPNSATHGGVALADIDGDGVVEAVTQGEQKLRVFDANSGALETTVRSSYGHTLFAPSSTPTIASVNGKTWIVQTAHGDANNNFARDSADELVVMVWQSASALGAAPWPTFKRNMARTSAPVPAPIDPVPTQNFVKQLYLDFLGRAPSPTELGDWSSSLLDRRVTRYNVATALSRSDEWITTVITNFYRNTLGREPDSSGLRGWIDAARSGMPVAQIAAAFYSSPEYFSTVGHNDYRTWVADLYKKLLLRTADEGGLNGWVAALNAGMPRDTVAFGFYQSAETLGVRITALYTKLLGRAPEAGAIPNWAPFVSNQGDLVLAAALAASDEYFTHANK
ncbi:hypothetical protein GCM10027052_02390 [Parafrigoribacterium mesophilum]